MTEQRRLNHEEIDALVREHFYAAGLGEDVGPLQHTLGFDDAQMAFWEETGEPPY